MPRAWILQSNPKKWDVWSWWHDQKHDLESWTIAIHTDDVAPGDRFALWIGGAEAGVYAMGKITSYYYGPLRVGGEYWVDPPNHDVYGIDLAPTHYLFDNPILKGELSPDPDFANALILRMPRTANPIPLEAAEWRAIQRRVGRGRLAEKPRASQPIVSARPLGRVPEDITVASRPEERNRVFREAQLLKRYEASIGRQLLARSVRLPSGELLVCDAFDSDRNELIEAKASASRQDIRMAVGQLLDYRRHVGKRSALAVLLPETPSSDLQRLLSEVHMTAIVESRRGRFRRL